MRKEMYCPKCKEQMDLISIDVDKIPKKDLYAVKYRYWCNKCKKPHFIKIGNRK